MMVGHSCPKTKQPQPAPPKTKQVQQQRQRPPKLIPTWFPKLEEPQVQEQHEPVPPPENVVESIVTKSHANKLNSGDAIAGDGSLTPVISRGNQVTDFYSGKKNYAQTTSLTMKNEFDILQSTNTVMVDQLPPDARGTLYKN